MKLLALLFIGLLLAIPITAVGCITEVSIPETKVASSCVTCHSDKALLQQTADPVTEEKSEATSGEG